MKTIEKTENCITCKLKTTCLNRVTKNDDTTKCDKFSYGSYADYLNYGKTGVMNNHNEIPTLARLNETDNPKRFAGECLGDDGQGNELWLFRSVNKLANRYSDDAGVVQWDDDIEGWNYTPDFALD